MKKFYYSLIILVVIITGIVSYQVYIEKAAENIITRVGTESIEQDWKKLKNILYAFNDHERIEDIDNEYIGMTNCDDEEHLELHTIYFKEKLKNLVTSTRPILVNIL